ncbi:hypothetical protein E2C01_025330 [Portunus trituberculatus]|uniref:Uncharacterized protein n=1 Tax=Portunus trituberculatus TaxID=210409 RepID=A0A5B7EFA9_PORTR|nr:hypothetical protein [Portunus trituberculatus]
MRSWNQVWFGSVGVILYVCTGSPKAEVPLPDGTTAITSGSEVELFSQSFANNTTLDDSWLEQKDEVLFSVQEMLVEHENKD